MEWRLGSTDPASPRLWHEPDVRKTPVTGDVAVEAKKRLDGFVRAIEAGNRARIAALLGAGTRAAYTCVRARVAPLVRDRVLDGDVVTARSMVASGEVERAVRAAGVALTSIAALRASRDP